MSPPKTQFKTPLGKALVNSLVGSRLSLLDLLYRFRYLELFELD